jgi:hypothetical protein
MVNCGVKSMIKVENNVVYKAFGLSIKSEIPLPQLPRLGTDVGSNIDVVVTKGDFSKKWFDLVGENQIVYIEENFIMYKFGDIGIFKIEDGNKISVFPLKDFDEDTAGVIILGTCMGAILIQRKVLPLHGSAVAINGKAYAIVGDSGAGKSTLARGFINSGFRILTDDVIAVSLKDNIPCVTPSYPQQKLWRDSLTSFGIKTDDFTSILGRANKFCVPISKHYFSNPLPLAGIIELIKTEMKDTIISPIENLKRFYTFYYHTYRNNFIHKSGLMDWHFQTSAKILKQVDMYQLQRPVSGCNSSELVSKILMTIDKGEK